MNSALAQIVNIYKSMPRNRKILIGSVLLLLVISFVSMFFWANKIDFQTAYTNLSPEDSAEVVQKLKEQQIPYRLAGNGNIIMVPGEKVYDIRLSMAGSGIPRGGVVGFEVFEKTDFGTTEFVQKLNYQRAIQGELARTIKQFREVLDARVMIVMPKDSVFIEESTPPSASVLLNLNSNFSQEKVAAVVHLVASAVEKLTPERVTVVDTNGKVLYKGNPEDDQIGTYAKTQFEYKIAFEQNLTRRIQTMLEKIVGSDKAIVRVIADMNFDQVDINEEIYDPDAQAIRSKHNIVETSDRKSNPDRNVSSVHPVGQPADATGIRQTSDLNQRQDETFNYEISRTIRRTVKPVAAIKRISVAVVLDGTYTIETGKEGNSVRKYVARSQNELDQFTQIVKKAMGYDADREDQVTVESFPFSIVQDMNLREPSRFEWWAFAKQYGQIGAYMFLVILIFICIVRPAVKTIREIKALPRQSVLPAPGEEKALAEPDRKEELPEPVEMTSREKAIYLAMQDMEKTADQIRGWLNEAAL